MTAFYSSEVRPEREALFVPPPNDAGVPAPYILSRKCLP